MKKQKNPTQPNKKKNSLKNTTLTKRPTGSKVILVIRDGWGHNSSKKNNAIYSARTPFANELEKKYPTTLLKASGKEVGLPKGYQGNSEVGHITIGAGRIINQSFQRINESIQDKTFFKNKEFINAINYAKKNNSSLHLIGLIQVEGVHSHLNHLFSLLDLCKKQNFFRTKIHVITDGRDSPVTNSIKHVKKIESKIKKEGLGEIVTISGRFYSMDRDLRWERTRKAFRVIVNAESKEEFVDPVSAIRKSHKKGITDEFIYPIKKKNYLGVKEKDSIIFFNYRTDRTRQLTKSIVEKNFFEWERKKDLSKIFFVGMTEYYSKMSARIAFKEKKLGNLLGEIISKKGLKQLRISETEKYAHVTFFFNGQNEKKLRGEKRILIPSPKVRTYDLKPEMSAKKVTKELLKEIKKQEHDFVVVNLVNCDMVGHTGETKAIIKAVETVDACTKKIINEGIKNKYTLLVFADHGNAEKQSKGWVTSHTTNPVPFSLISYNEELNKVKLKKGLGLKDVAPTVLELMGIKKPREMSGESIIKK